MPKREIIRPEGIPVPDASFSPVIRYGRWVFVSGMMATDYKSGIAPEARGNQSVPLAGEHPMLLESRQVLKLLDRAATAGGSTLANAVRIDQFPTSRAMVDPYHEERKVMIKPPRPASTSVVIGGLMAPACNTAVELVCTIPERGFEKEGITSDKIPQPIGGYAPAIRAGDFVFVAGQVPSDFTTGLAPKASVHPEFWQERDRPPGPLYARQHQADARGGRIVARQCCQGRRLSARPPGHPAPRSGVAGVFPRPSAGADDLSGRQRRGSGSPHRDHHGGGAGQWGSPQGSDRDRQGAGAAVS